MWTAMWAAVTNAPRISREIGLPDRIASRHRQSVTIVKRLPFEGTFGGCVSLSSPLCERATDPRALGVGTEEDRPRVAHGRRDRCVPTRPSTLNPNPKTRPSTGHASIPVPISRLGIIPRTRRETGDVRGRTLPVPFVNVHHNATRLHVSRSTTTDEIPRLRTDTRFAHVSTRIVTHEPVLSLPTFRAA